MCSAAAAQDMSVFHGCPMQGNALQADNKRLNAQKNRFDLPAQRVRYFRVRLADVLQRGPDANRFPAGVPTEMVGFVRLVKAGSKETCNCHEPRDKRFLDTHIELVPSPEQNDPRRIVIIEVSPRVRQIMLDQSKDWSTDELIRTLTNQWVRVRGWLLYDHEHTENADATNPGGRRIFKGGNWEIHPITDIKIIPAPRVRETRLSGIKTKRAREDEVAVPTEEDAVVIEPIFETRRRRALGRRGRISRQRRQR